MKYPKVFQSRRFLGHTDSTVLFWVPLIQYILSKFTIIHGNNEISLFTVLMDVRIKSLGIDLLTICPHKFHGSKGIDALYIHQGIKLESIL